MPCIRMDAEARSVVGIVSFPIATGIDAQYASKPDGGPP